MAEWKTDTKRSRQRNRKTSRQMSRLEIQIRREEKREIKQNRIRPWKRWSALKRNFVGSVVAASVSMIFMRTPSMLILWVDKAWAPVKRNRDFEWRDTTAVNIYWVSRFRSRTTLIEKRELTATGSRVDCERKKSIGKQTKSIQWSDKIETSMKKQK